MTTILIGLFLIAATMLLGFYTIIAALTIYKNPRRFPILSLIQLIVFSFLIVWIWYKF